MNSKTTLLAASFSASLVALASAQTFTVGTVAPNADDITTLALMNRARADPTGEIGRLLGNTSWSTGITAASTPYPSTTADGTAWTSGFWAGIASGTAGSELASSMDFFNVHPGALLNQSSALTGSGTLQPYVWDLNLGSSADQYTDLMVADAGATSNPHYIAPYDTGSFFQRYIDAGYVGQNTNGENLFRTTGAATLDAMFGGFFVDYGGASTLPSGIQNPAGHRNSILSTTFTEVGLDTKASYVAGQRSQTHHFGAQFADRYGYGYAFQDSNTNGIYDFSEAQAGQIIEIFDTASGTALATTVTTDVNGGFIFDLASLGLTNGGSYEFRLQSDSTVLNGWTYNNTNNFSTGAQNLLISAAPSTATGNIWDDNGNTAGSGATGGNWSDGSWTTDATGGSATGAWTDDNVLAAGVDTLGNVAFFSAGSDQTTAISVAADQNATLTGIKVEEAGDVTISTGGGVLTLNGAPMGADEGSATAVDVNVVNAAATLTIAQPLTGATTADGLDKQGPGTLVLSGANTYIGDTNVNAGELRVTGSTTSDTTVASGATISGTGTITGDLTVAASGDFRPGNNAVGNLTVTGATTFDDDTNLFFELDTPGGTEATASTTGDHAAFSGNVSLDGNLDLSGAGANFGSGFYELASVGGTLTNGFTNDDTDFVEASIPDDQLVYHVYEGSIDLAVADKPNLEYDGSTTAVLTGGGTIMIDLGTFTEGAVGTGNESFDLINTLTGANLRLDGNISAISALTGSSLFSLTTAPGTGGLSANGSDALSGLVDFASLASTPTGTYSADLEVDFDSILGSLFAPDNNSGSFSFANGSDDFNTVTAFIPSAFSFLGGTTTLRFTATVTPVPEPSRALLIAVGLGLALLRRRR